jgi:hypothetical protein
MALLVVFTGMLTLAAMGDNLEADRNDYRAFAQEVCKSRDGLLTKIDGRIVCVREAR